MLKKTIIILLVAIFIFGVSFVIYQKKVNKNIIDNKQINFNKTNQNGSGVSFSPEETNICNNLKSDECYFKKAVVNYKEEGCDKISIQELKEKCLEKIAYNIILTKEKNILRCYDLDFEEYRDSCLRRFYENFKELEECDVLKEEDKIKCTDLIYGKLSYQFIDYKYCDNIQDDALRKKCFKKKLPTDTDGDGLSDRYEKERRLNINKSDTDGDGLSDFEEIYKYKSNPLQLDTDKDGYPDGEEVRKGYNPNGVGKLVF